MAELNFSIDTEKKIINGVFKGHIQSEDLIKYILTLREDPDFNTDLNTIADFREASFSQGYTEIAKVADFMRSISPSRGDFRLSILVKTPSQNRSANLYTVIANDENVKVFNCQKQAEEWVSGYYAPIDKCLSLNVNVSC